MNKFRIAVVLVISYMAALSAQNIDSKKFALVEGGKFKSKVSNYYGSEVIVSPFWIGIHEVTQQEWKEIVGYSPSFTRGNNLPVHNVSWYDCIEYCNKRSIKEGLTPFYTVNKETKDTHNYNTAGTDKFWTVTINPGANGYRLPSEAEWEYAATGGNKSKSFRYSGSKNIDDVAIYSNGINPNEKVMPIGSKKQNELGVFDMSGNVGEWCWDWYSDNVSSSGNDPCGSQSGTDRVVRGGAWNELTLSCLVNSRQKFIPAYDNQNVGLRLARSK